MWIYLMRHVEAQPREEVSDDDGRAITARGEQRLRKAMRGLRRLELFPDRLLCSPLKRALQTAAIVAEELGFTGDVEAVDELSPESAPEELVEVLKTLHCEQILLVGHQPLLGQIVLFLCGMGAHGRIAVKKGGLVRIDVESWGEDPPGQLQGLYTVKQLAWMRKKKKKSDGDTDDSPL